MPQPPRCWAETPWTNHMTPEQKKANLRTGLILASIALVFFLGFMAKMLMLGK